MTIDIALVMDGFRLTAPIAQGLIQCRGIGVTLECQFPLSALLIDQAPVVERSGQIRPIARLRERFCCFLVSLLCRRAVTQRKML